MPSTELTPIPRIESHIHLIRGQKVLVDADLAALYQVPTSAFNQAVKRNESRFPKDFRFRVTKKEEQGLRSQSVISKGGRRYLPYVFSELGVAMLSSVLKSERAIQVNIEIMRTFVRMRHFLATHEELTQRLEGLERQQLNQDQRLDGNTQDIEYVFAMLEQMTAPPVDPDRRRIGFSDGV